MRPAFCEQHATDGMVKISVDMCVHDACKTVPRYNVQGSKGPTICMKHAGDGMVKVIRKRCSPTRPGKEGGIDENGRELRAKQSS